MVNDFGEAIAAFVTMPETRQIAQPKELNTTNVNRKRAAPHRKIGLPLQFISVIVKTTAISPLSSSLIVFQSLLPQSIYNNL